MNSISKNLQHVHARIEAACKAVGRDPATVHLLAVSKTVSLEKIRQAVAAGQRAFGENYVQEGVEKIKALQELHLEWHCIGPIQSNKTRLVAEHFDWVHTIDNLKTAQRLSDQRPAHLAPLQVCLQVNVDGGINKSGMPPGQALALAQTVSNLPRLALRGLMSIPEPAIDSVTAKAVHIATADLFSRINTFLPGPTAMDTLSLGMSADLQAAVQAGSTLVRVGSAIFGARY